MGRLKGARFGEARLRPGRGRYRLAPISIRKPDTSNWTTTSPGADACPLQRDARDDDLLPDDDESQRLRLRGRGRLGSRRALFLRINSSVWIGARAARRAREPWNRGFLSEVGAKIRALLML